MRASEKRRAGLHPARFLTAARRSGGIRSLTGTPLMRGIRPRNGAGSDPLARPEADGEGAWVNNKGHCYKYSIVKQARSGARNTAELSWKSPRFASTR